MDNKLIASLKETGLTDKEARIYLALLQLGRASVVSVANRAEVKRPTTYVLLEEMVEKGLVQLVPKTRKKLYRASEPKALLRNFQERLEQLESIIPRLQAMQRSSDTSVQTLYFEGIRGVADALAYGVEDMQNGELVGFYATTLNAPEELTSIFSVWQEHLYEHNIKVRGIAPKHKSLQKTRKADKTYGREFRQITYSEYSANVSIDAGDDFIRIVAFRDLQAVVIHNPEVAETFRQIFRMVWRLHE